MAAPFIESWNREVGWKNALRRAEMPAADGLIAAKWLSCCYKLQLPCAHWTSALVSRLSTFYPVFCTVDVAFAPDVGDRLSAVLSHIATCHRFTFLVFDIAGAQDRHALFLASVTARESMYLSISARMTIKSSKLRRRM